MIILAASFDVFRQISVVFVLAVVTVVTVLLVVGKSVVQTGRFILKIGGVTIK